MQLWSLFSPFWEECFFVGIVAGTVSNACVAACGLMTITSIFGSHLDIVGNPFESVEDMFFLENEFGLLWSLLTLLLLCRFFAKVLFTVKNSSR